MPSTPENYLKLAHAMNEIAGEALKLDRPRRERETDGNKGKISLGLSLQAAELAGKGMLLALGVSPGRVRNKFRDHDLMRILLEVERRLLASQIPRHQALQNYLDWAPVIDGVQFATTMRAYFNLHFASGDNAKPRNYLYPDLPTYAGPDPFDTLHVIVDRLIFILRELIAP